VRRQHEGVGVVRHRALVHADVADLARVPGGGDPGRGGRLVGELPGGGVDGVEVDDAGADRGGHRRRRAGEHEPVAGVDAGGDGGGADAAFGHLGAGEAVDGEAVGAVGSEDQRLRRVLRVDPDCGVGGLDRGGAGAGGLGGGGGVAGRHGGVGGGEEGGGGDDERQAERGADRPPGGGRDSEGAGGGHGGSPPGEGAHARGGSCGR